AARPAGDLEQPVDRVLRDRVRPVLPDLPDRPHQLDDVARRLRHHLSAPFACCVRHHRGEGPAADPRSRRTSPRDEERTDMTSQRNLRARIAAGDEAVALRAEIGWSKDRLAAAWGGARYDFIWLDAQHSPYSDDQLVNFTGSAEQLGIPVQLRIPHTRDAHKVGRFFDLGITGALVPEVMEAATVQDAIDFAYYGPLGRRSWGGANRLGLRPRTAPTARREYAAWWNDTVLLSIQIESVQTVTNIKPLV